MVKKGMLGGLLLIIGAILLVVSLLVGWYVYNVSASASGETESGTQTYNLGSSYTQSVSGPLTGSHTTTCPYSGNSTCPDLKNTSALYADIQYVVIGGIVLGFLGGILALMGGSRPGMRKAGIALGIIALLLAIAAPMTLLAVQPGTVKSDEGMSYVSNGSGPDHSFFGSCSNSACPNVFGAPPGVTYTSNWGPGAGWYLSVVGFVILLVGVLMSRGGKEPAAAPAASTPAPMDASGQGAPPMSPPASPPS